VNGNGKKGKKGSEGWADPRTDDQRLMIKLGSNRVVDFDGRLDVLNLLRNLVRRASKALSPEETLHTELLGLDMGVKCIDPFAVQGAKGQAREKVGWGSTNLFAANQENNKT
jgi:hypothetical protein